MACGCTSGLPTYVVVEFSGIDNYAGFICCDNPDCTPQHTIDLSGLSGHQFILPLSGGCVGSISGFAIGNDCVILNLSVDISDLSSPLVTLSLHMCLREGYPGPEYQTFYPDLYFHFPAIDANHCSDFSKNSTSITGDYGFVNPNPPGGSCSIDAYSPVCGCNHGQTPQIITMEISGAENVNGFDINGSWTLQLMSSGMTTCTWLGYANTISIVVIIEGTVTYTNNTTIQAIADGGFNLSNTMYCYDYEVYVGSGVLVTMGEIGGTSSILKVSMVARTSISNVTGVSLASIGKVVGVSN